MIRRVINIDEEKCNGCGICVNACHEGAIGLVDGKAKLLRDDYCDGLGDCLPTCPYRGLLLSLKEKRLHMMKQQLRKICVRESGSRKRVGENSCCTSGVSRTENDAT